MGCNCGGGSTKAWSPGSGSTPAPEGDSPVSATFPHIPVHQRPGRIGAPAWLPEPKGEPATPTHEQ